MEVSGVEWSVQVRLRGSVRREAGLAAAEGGHGKWHDGEQKAIHARHPSPLHLSDSCVSEVRLLHGAVLLLLFPLIHRLSRRRCQPHTQQQQQ